MVRTSLFAIVSAVSLCCLFGVRGALAVREARGYASVKGAAPSVVELDAIKDNTLFLDEAGAVSNGIGEYLFVGTTATFNIRRSVMAFDVAGAIPEGSTIISAQLTLRMSRTISPGQPTTLHRVEADWGEGTSDADYEEGRGSDSTPDDATWIHRFFDTEFWTSEGGDFDAAQSATTSVAGTGDYTWGSTAEMIADVQDWLDNPATNFGWLLKGNESESGTAKRFDSRENMMLANRPVLAIEYVLEHAPVTTDGIIDYILRLNDDPTGLDVNKDALVDVADVVYLARVEGGNQAPLITPQPVYRAFPGFSIELPIGATDPEGAHLTYNSEMLPDGATLDAETGVLSWTPTAEQLGPAYVHFTVTDDDVIPRSSSGILIFQIAPLSECVLASCDPASGCELELRPIEENCCIEEPSIRLAEPDAPCPEGLVLFAGRNERGFGRLANCDRLQLVAFAQGGFNVTLHFEARCIDESKPVAIRSRLETADEVLFDVQQNAQLNPRPDGFSQAFGLNFALGYEIDVFELEGRQALLSTTLTDDDGVVVTQELRLTLTLNELNDLPNPNQIISPGGEIGCIGCHRPIDPITLTRTGIKDPHPWYALSCTDCHGGNNEVNTFGDAHVFPDTGPTFIRNLAYDQLNAVPLDYVRFVNPGDLRVAAQSCGAASPASDGGGCHQSIVESVPGSVMSTYAGHYKLPRFLAGGQDRDPVLAAVDIVDPDWNPDTAPIGTVGELTALREPTQADRSELIAAMDIYLPKSCATCHLSDFGTNNGPGKYRSSGCTACHMVYDNDGLSDSEDPAIFGYIPPFPIEHILTTAIPTEQCAHCHFQGGRIGLAFRGIREGGFSPANTPPNAVPLGVSLYGHDPNFYFSDEDDTNNFDETPPDLHFSAGMACADCHVGSDVHGDGYIYASERDQVGIRCEDCHGTVRDAILEDEVSGFFTNSKGSPLKHLRRDGGTIFLALAMGGGAELRVPQIAELLEAANNPRMVEAMGIKESGFAHPDQMECYACHNGWRQTCFGCHVRINDDVSQLNHTTGEISQGGFSVSRDIFSIDFFTLGMNDRNKITPLCSSMSVFVSYRKDGTFQYEDKVRQPVEGTKGFGWNPFHHHTVSRVPMNCDTCHPVDSVVEPSNMNRLNETYGFGNGEILAVDGDGTTHDLTAFLDAEGNLISTFAHPGTSPVPMDTRERALSILVEPQPR